MQPELVSLTGTGQQQGLPNRGPCHQPLPLSGYSQLLGGSGSLFDK